MSNLSFQSLLKMYDLISHQHQKILLGQILLRDHYRDPFFYFLRVIPKIRVVCDCVVLLAHLRPLALWYELFWFRFALNTFHCLAEILVELINLRLNLLLFLRPLCRFREVKRILLMIR